MNSIIENRQRIANSLITHSVNERSIGLLTGIMGVLITIALYARRYKQDYLEYISDEMFEAVCRKSAIITNTDFASGLAGISWGAEYLSQHGIISLSGEEICGNLDPVIMEHNILRVSDFSLDTGLVGLLHYVLARLRGNIKANLARPFDDSYLTDWETVIRNNSEKFPMSLTNDFFSLIEGRLPDSDLSLKVFICVDPTFSDKMNISLYSGMAGYLVKHYL